MGSDAYTAFKDFLASSLTRDPRATVGIMLGVAVIQWFRINIYQQGALDSAHFSISLMTAMRSLIYDILLHRMDVDQDSAAAWSIVGAVIFALAFFLVSVCARRAIRPILMVLAMFIVFVVIYNKNPWPIYVSLGILLMGACCVYFRKHLKTVLFVIIISLWYTAHIVYDTSYFVSSNYAEMQDLIDDAGKGLTDCTHWCLARRCLTVSFALLRMLLAAVYFHKLETSKAKEDVAKRKEMDLKAIEEEDGIGCCCSRDRPKKDDDEDAGDVESSKGTIARDKKKKETSGEGDDDEDSGANDRSYCCCCNTDDDNVDISSDAAIS